MRHRALAYVLTGVVVVLWVPGGVFLTLDRHVISGNQWFLWGLFTVTGAAYVASALAIVRRQPRRRDRGPDCRAWPTG
jgi:hypothetical protein